MTNNQASSNVTPQAGEQTNPPVQATTSTPQAGESNSTPNTQTQSSNVDELLRQIADLRKENASHRKKANEQASAAQQAEEQRLREQGEFKQLAEKHEAKVKELEPIAHRYSTLAEQVNAQIEAEIKDWPQEVKAFDPGKDAPVEQRLEWRNKSRPLIEKLQTQARTTSPGNSPGPRPAQPTSSERERLEQDKAWLRTKRSYGF